MSDHSEPSRIFYRYQQLIDISRDLVSIVNIDSLLERICQAAVDITHSEQHLC